MSEPYATKPPEPADERAANPSDTPAAGMNTPAAGGPASRLAFEPGARPLPDYELVRVLGRGGFGEVWQANGPGGFAVALKFIRLGDLPGRLELRSLELMKPVRHAHLLTLFGAWQRDDWLILAMELAEGTLHERWRQANEKGSPGIPAPELAEYLREAAKGIDYLNERRHPDGQGGLVSIQHRDIKPQNLLLVGGTVKVADFGLAKLLEHTVAAASGSMTPVYAAPEFFGNQATRWSDQYSLAVTYCQLRGGKLPFEGSPWQVMSGHLTQAPDLTMLPEAERPAVARALAKKPEERWDSCRDFADAIGAVIPAGRGRRPPPAMPAPPSAEALFQHPTTGRRRRPLLVGLGASALAGILLAVFLVVWKGSPPAPGTGDLPPSVATSREANKNDSRAERKPEEKPAPTPVLKLLPTAPLTLAAGREQDLVVQIERINCAGDVHVEVTALPDGVTAGSNLLIADKRDDLRVKLSAKEDVLSAEKTIRIRAHQGALQAEQAVTLKVEGKPFLGLKLAATELTLVPGGEGNLELQLQRRNCSEEATVRVIDLPTGVEAPPVLFGAGKDSGKLRLNATSSAAPTARKLRVQAVAGGTLAEAEFQLTIGFDRAGQDRAVTEIERLGGKVKRGGGPDNLVVEVELSKTQVTDGALVHLKPLAGLQVLKLRETQIGDEGLAHLKNLVRLQELDLYDCHHVDKNGLAQIRGLIGLQMLDLRGTKIDDQAMEHLKSFPQLRSLVLSMCSDITDAGMENLKHLTGLRHLELAYCTKITDDGFASLKDLIHLDYLWLHATNIGDPGLKHLQKLTRLHDLILTRCEQLTDAGLGSLKALTGLRRLDLDYTNVGDPGLAQLKALPQLESLNLGHTKVTEAGVMDLQQAAPKLSVSR
jgi:serine/threonine protein kinase